MKKDELKKKFATGETPTEQDFHALIDEAYDKPVTKKQYDDLLKRVKALEGKK